VDEIQAKINRTLAADIRFSPINLTNDQVWEFNGANGEPPALAVQTTYGLQSRGIRIFPRFTLQGTTLTDPRTFASAGKIEKRFSNYLQISCSPFSSIDVEIEFWVPTSNSICGRTRIFNSGKGSVTLNCEWAVLLQPQGKGETMTSAEMGVNTVLRGASGDLYPVFFLTGGPEPSSKSYPALSLEITLAAGAERRVSWSLATLNSHEASFTMARQNTALPWDAELVKYEMEEKNKIFHFNSADPVLDDLLHESQIKARQCLIQGPVPEKRYTLLPTRQPDEPLGSFMILPAIKRGNLPASVYDLWQASRILLPAEAELFKDLIFGFIDTQVADGTIPWAIRPDGTPTKAMTPPLLAGIARDVNIYLQDTTWLTQVYAPLLEAFKKWITSGKEKNASGWPIWDHLLQTGLDASPLYSIWRAQDQGVDLQFIDAPALGAMLYHECQALIQISQVTGKNEESSWLQATAAMLKEHVLASWNDTDSNFQDRDVETGQSLSGRDLHLIKTNGSFRPRITCKGERRLLVHCIKAASIPKTVEITLHGENNNGPITENFHFSPSQFHEGIARGTSRQLFTHIEAVDITGLQKADQVQISLAGYNDEDISLLLPIWAGIPSAEQVKQLVEKTMLPRYLTKFGLTNLPGDHYPENDSLISPFWNTILVEGLLNYGMRETAASVLQALLAGISIQWQASGFLNDAIRAGNGQGAGNRDSAGSLVAILPFLRILGIERIYPNEIIFNGLNEFFAPFTVQYKRAKIQLNPDCTTVFSLNGSKIDIRETGMQKIILP